MGESAVKSGEEACEEGAYAPLIHPYCRHGYEASRRLIQALPLGSQRVGGRSMIWGNCLQRLDNGEVACDAQ